MKASSAALFHTTSVWFNAAFTSQMLTFIYGILLVVFIGYEIHWLFLLECNGLAQTQY